jgi:hypothetical protein
MLQVFRPTYPLEAVCEDQIQKAAVPGTLNSLSDCLLISPKQRLVPENQWRRRFALNSRRDDVVLFVAFHLSSRNFSPGSSVEAPREG